MRTFSEVGTLDNFRFVGHLVTSIICTAAARYYGICGLRFAAAASLGINFSSWCLLTKKATLSHCFFICPGGGTRTPMLARQILSLICLPISPHPAADMEYLPLEGANILRFFNSSTKVFVESFLRLFLCYFATLIATYYALTRSLHRFFGPQFLLF